MEKKFMLEISKISDAEILIGLARILKVNLMIDKDTPKTFSDVFEEIMAAFSALGRNRKRELYKILKAANREGLDAGRTKDSK